MNLSRKRRLAVVESAHGLPDPDRLVSAADQFDIAAKLHRCYGEPGSAPPRLDDFQPRRQAEIDAEWQEAIERVYGVAP